MVHRLSVRGARTGTYAQEITNRAIRRIGELLKETPKASGNVPGESHPRALSQPSPRQQVGKKASAQSQQIAALPEETFQATNLPYGDIEPARAQVGYKASAQSRQIAALPEPGSALVGTGCPSHGPPPPA